MMRRSMAVILAGLMAGLPGFAQQQTGDGTFTMKVQTDIVLTNVVVRDKKTGEVVKGLKQSDFRIMENGKLQTIASFDYQNVDEAAGHRESATLTGKATMEDRWSGGFAARRAGRRDNRLSAMIDRRSNL